VRLHDEGRPALLDKPQEDLDQDADYFSDGLAADVINALTRVPGVKVTAQPPHSRSGGRYKTFARLPVPWTSALFLKVACDDPDPVFA